MVHPHSRDFDNCDAVLEEAAACVVQLVAAQGNEAAFQRTGQSGDRAFLSVPSVLLMLLSKQDTWCHPADKMQMLD